MANKKFELSFGVLGGGSVSAGSGAEILRDLKSIVSQIESSGITKLKFKVDTSGIAKDIQRQMTSDSSSGGYWQGRFKDEVKGITATNDGLKQMGKQYKQLEAASDSFLKKNLSAIDYSIKAREAEGKQFASQLRAKMQLESDAAKVIEENRNNFAKKNLSDIDYAIKAREVEGKQFANQLKSRMQAEQAAIAQRNKSESESIKLNEKRTNTITQNTNVLNQALRTYQKYEDSIKRVSRVSGVSLDDDFKSFISKMQSDPKFANTKEARREFALLERQMLEMGATAETTWERLKRLFEAHLGTAVAMVGIHMLQRSLREMYQNVVQLDKALVDLQIATGYTREQTRNLISDYSELAKQLGATTLEVAKASDGWLRQGFSVEQTNTLIKNSMMLSKLGQIESSEATTALTSSMKGYNVAVEDSVKIVDKLVSVDMKAAVSAGDIATAMSKTATSARLAGIDMNTLVGYIAAVAETTQAGAEEVGNFYKTLFARMGNIKEGRLIDPETGENLGSVETALSAVGIKLRETTGEFRDFDKVLAEVADGWDSYGTVQQRALAVAFSGVRQQEKFLVLMEKFGEAMEYAGVATDSAGTALDKYENSYLKGIEAAQNNLKASFEALSTTILNGDLVKGAFNTGAGILGFLNSILSVGDGVIVKISMIAGAIAILNKAFASFNAISLASTGRTKVTVLVNMPVNDPMATWNELTA